MKVKISVLNHDLERYGLISDYQSFSFVRHYNDTGEFTLVLNADCHEAHLLQRGTFILVDDDEEKFGLITHRHFTEEEGNELFTYKGKTLGVLLNYRTMVLGENEVYEKVDGNVESVIYQYVYNHLINPNDSGRRIPQLTQAEDFKRGKYIRWISNNEYLIDTIKTICEIYNIGWRIRADIDSGKWVFEVYSGLNLTKDSDNPVIFSKKHGNVSSMEYTEDDTDLRNFAYVLSDDDSNHLREVSNGNEEGFLRRETVFNINRYDSDEEYVDVRLLASQQLEEHYVTKSIEAEINEGCGTFRLGVDCFLGDTVTVENESWGIAEDLVISRIEELYSSDEKKTYVTFGKRIPALIDKIKRDTKVREIK